MKVGVWAETNSRYSDSLRLAEMIPYLAVIPGITCEAFVPFSNYSHLIVSDKILNPQNAEILSSHYKGTKVYLDGDSEKYTKLFTKAVTNITDGVSYRRAKMWHGKVEKVLWLGTKSSFKQLSALEPFWNMLASKRIALSVITDNFSEFQKLNLPIHTVHQQYSPDIIDGADCIIAHSQRALLEGWVRRIPVIAAASTPCDELYAEIYRHSGLGAHYKEICRSANKATEFAGFFDLLELTPEPFLIFAEAARRLVLSRELVQHKAIQWAEVLNA